MANPDRSGEVLPDPPQQPKTRRRNARSPVLIAALVVSLVAAVPGILAEPAPDPQRLVLDMTGWQDNTVVVPPEHYHTNVPAEARKIGPGTRLVIRRGASTFGCTAGFVFKGVRIVNGVRVTRNYLSSAGHCFLPEDRVASHGAGADYRAYKYNKVYACISECRFGGQLGFLITGRLVRLGSVAYARQSGRGGEVGNDFGLVHIPKALTKLIRRSMPVWGGPTTTQNVTRGSVTCHYGNGLVVGETFPTRARSGVGGGANSREWGATHPAAFGDSGSALNVCEPHAGGLHGRGAAGILTHIGLAVSTSRGATTAFGTTVPRGIRLARQVPIYLTIHYGK
jgi:hypothetical protein